LQWTREYKARTGFSGPGAFITYFVNRNGHKKWPQLNYGGKRGEPAADRLAPGFMRASRRPGTKEKVMFRAGLELNLCRSQLCLCHGLPSKFSILQRPGLAKGMRTSDSSPLLGLRAWLRSRIELEM
jgi:hypothetical protein